MIPVERLTATAPRTTADAAMRYDPAATRKFGALRRLGRPVNAQDPRTAREAAALLTSQLFFAPVLAEMRQLPFGREFGHGGRMEEAFGEQLDQRIADAVARSDRGLTAYLAERLSPARTRSAPQAPARDPSEPAAEARDHPASAPRGERSAAETTAQGAAAHAAAAETTRRTVSGGRDT